MSTYPNGVFVGKTLDAQSWVQASAGTVVKGLKDRTCVILGLGIMLIGSPLLVLVCHMFYDDSLPRSIFTGVAAGLLLSVVVGMATWILNGVITKMHAHRKVERLEDEGEILFVPNTLRDQWVKALETAGADTQGARTPDSLREHYPMWVDLIKYYLRSTNTPSGDLKAACERRIAAQMRHEAALVKAEQYEERERQIAEILDEYNTP